MKNLELISEELFNKIRGRFPSVTIGNNEGVVTNVPKEARFFDFDFKEGSKNLGKVSISVDENSLSIMYSNNFIEGQDKFTKEKWYGFLKELRYFAKKRLLNFDTRDITKSNLNRRDYKFLANQSGEQPMSESKMYGTSKTSYQDIGNARLTVKHSAPVNQELAGGRTQKISALYIESADGERFKYPYKHLSGARAMTRHVAEGGKPYDDFGKHITEMSTELYNLKKFKNYMARSSVMAESLAEYVGAVNERIETVKKTLEKIQREGAYKEAFEGFESVMMEEVPTDVAENWIDQLTIRQFNEELKDVFPYIYKLVSEKTIAEEIGPENFIEAEEDMYTVRQGDTVYSLSQMSGTSVEDIIEINGLDDQATIKVGQELRIPGINDIGASPVNPGATRGIDPRDNYSPEDLERLMNQDIHSEEIDQAFEGLMGQFAESTVEEGYMKGYQKYHCEDCGCQMHNCAPDCQCEHDSHDEKGSWWKDENGNGVPDAMEGNKFTMALKKAKDDDEDEMDVDGKKIPVTEFVLSLFDRETGQFPKGETAVLTAVEKDYGEEYIAPAKQFIERIIGTYEQYASRSQDDGIITDDEPQGTVMEPTIDQEEADLRRLAGL